MFNNHFVILTLTPRFQNGLILFALPSKILYAFIIVCVRATYFSAFISRRDEV